MVDPTIFELTAGYLCSFVIGIIMGLVGGGASLLLPVMLYLLYQPTNVATAYTLILGGVTAWFGVFPRIKSGHIDYSTAFSLGTPILIATLFVRAWLVDQIPDVLYQSGSVLITKQMCTMLLFASVLLISFASMTGLIGRNLKPRPEMKQEQPLRYYTLLITSGLVIGFVSALIGAGGGVMMVPLLVILFGLEMNTVVGTVLFIIAVKSVIGFSGDLLARAGVINLPFLAGFAAVMIGGILSGTAIASRLRGNQLKTLLAWFLLLLAIFIIVTETFSHAKQPDRPGMENVDQNSPTTNSPGS